MRSNLGVSSFLAALCLLAITASCTVRTKTANNTNVGDVSSEDHRANLDGLLPDSDGQDTGKDTDVMAPPDSVDDMTPACLSDAECDDLNPCTDDKCDPKVGCQHTNNQAECEAGLCTVNDRCSGGVCAAGTAKECDDLNPCTDDECDTETGECVTTDNSAPCDDMSKCTLNDRCFEGACKSTDALECIDNDPCTDVACDPEEGCVFPYNTADCDDGNGCTTGDKCADGTCVGTPTLGCQCTIGMECDPFEDGDLCNGTLKCEDSQCQVDDTTKIYCLDDNTNDCAAPVCVPASGACEMAIVEDGYPCEEGNLCTTGDRCEGGECMAGNPAICDDYQICTTDTCQSDVGCVFTANTELCNDSNLCTDFDICTEGACVGLSVTCDDNNPCTDDTCDAAEGCKFTPNTTPCNDNNACTENDVCAANVCAGTAVVCDDNNLCTDDTCSTSLGCQHTNNSTPCNDLNPCTDNDACLDGACQGGEAHPCDDGNICTTEICIPGIGCDYQNNSNACVNLNLCTEDDYCLGGTCRDGTAVDCDDSNDCTIDLCMGAMGCVHTKKLDNSGCDDGVACTTGDKCTNGVCGGTGPNCDDGNPCTDDKCDNIAIGCYHVNDNTNKCSDLNACTMGDKCVAGVCKGLMKLCSDGNACTTDSCNALTGCQFVNNTDSCNDGNACTNLDKCSKGECKGGLFVLCMDFNACTKDSCDPATGCVFTPFNGGCSDGDSCTTGDVCVAGKCLTTGTLSCNDNNVCTNDSCAPASGCVNAPNTAPCDDYNTCNGSDTCAGGACVPGNKDLCTGCGISAVAGCNGCACEACVCAEDPYCCNTLWDSTCVQECKNASKCPQTCQYNGCNPLPMAGCNNCPCQAKVCAADAYCCSVQWDSQCATACKNAGSSCGAPGGAGCQVGYGTDNKGCAGCSCEAAVCAVDSYCCSTMWDSNCVSECKNVGSAHCADTGGRGCMVHSTAGCNGCACEAAVCAADPYCCTTAWDSSCKSECQQKGFVCN